MKFAPKKNMSTSVIIKPSGLVWESEIPFQNNRIGQHTLVKIEKAIRSNPDAEVLIVTFNSASENPSSVAFINKEAAIEAFSDLLNLLKAI